MANGDFNTRDRTRTSVLYEKKKRAAYCLVKKLFCAFIIGRGVNLKNNIALLVRNYTRPTDGRQVYGNAFFFYFLRPSSIPLPNPSPPLRPSDIKHTHTCVYISSQNLFASHMTHTHTKKRWPPLMMFILLH